VTPVSSVIAFLARAERDADAAALLASLELDDEARVIARAQSVPTAQRLAWMATHTARRWSAADLAHAEARTFVAIRRQLQAKGLFSSDLRASASPR
jgi:hypothetical protein